MPKHRHRARCSLCTQLLHSDSQFAKADFSVKKTEAWVHPLPRKLPIHPNNSVNGGTETVSSLVHKAIGKTKLICDGKRDIKKEWATPRTAANWREIQHKSFHFSSSHFPNTLVAQMVKNLPALWKIRVQSLGQEDPLEKGNGYPLSILAWKIPWTEEPGSPWCCNELDTTEQLTKN